MLDIFKHLITYQTTQNNFFSYHAYKTHVIVVYVFMQYSNIFKYYQAIVTVNIDVFILIVCTKNF